LRVLSADPHADAITWPGPSAATISEPLDLGPFEDATAAKVLLLRRHVLLGGVSGSGKSGGLNVLMGNLAACRDVVIWAIDLKRGMELGPWASCIDRLATTPAEARALLADAVAVLEARASMLAASGQRVWLPSPDTPALVIVVDEYAELADDAPEATGAADSVARRGRAVAVTLVAATQRPTQKAMGQGALRSQMDVRISPDPGLPGLRRARGDRAGGSRGTGRAGTCRRRAAADVPASPGPGCWPDSRPLPCPRSRSRAPSLAARLPYPQTAHPSRGAWSSTHCRKPGCRRNDCISASVNHPVASVCLAAYAANGLLTSARTMWNLHPPPQSCTSTPVT